MYVVYCTCHDNAVAVTKRMQLRREVLQQPYFLLLGNILGISLRENFLALRQQKFLAQVRTEIFGVGFGEGQPQEGLVGDARRGRKIQRLTLATLVCKQLS